MKQEHVLIGRITGQQMYRVPEFGTRASFTLECSGQCSVACRIAGDVAHGFLASCREGDIVAVDGRYLRTASVDSFSQDAMGRPLSRPRFAHLGIRPHCGMSAEQIR